MKNRLVFTFPMRAETRQREFNMKMLIDAVNLKDKTEYVSFSHYHFKKLYLEGTGVLIFDTINRKVYVNLSPRADKSLLTEFMAKFNEYVKKDPYKEVTFKAFNDKNAIYHTNVMLGMLTNHAVVALDSIKSKKEREDVVRELTDKASNKKPKKLIEISMKEVNDFCGNVL